jgi:hypothetical protein
MPLGARQGDTVVTLTFFRMILKYSVSFPASISRYLHSAGISHTRRSSYFFSIYSNLHNAFAVKRAAVSVSF